MASYHDPLSSVKVASPCSADWERMLGNERQRFCGQCQLNVYNLSGMSRREAEDLITRAEGRLCVRFYRRADGTILTKDCPVGLRAIKRRLSRLRNAVVSSVLSFFAGLGVAAASRVNEPQAEIGDMVIPVTETAPDAKPKPDEQRFEIMGGLVAPTLSRLR
jgi:hypothetical protein